MWRKHFFEALTEEKRTMDGFEQKVIPSFLFYFFLSCEKRREWDIVTGMGKVLDAAADPLLPLGGERKKGRLKVGEEERKRKREEKIFDK